MYFFFYAISFDQAISFKGTFFSLFYLKSISHETRAIDIKFITISFSLSEHYWHFDWRFEYSLSFAYATDVVFFSSYTLKCSKSLKLTSCTYLVVWRIERSLSNMQIKNEPCQSLSFRLKLMYGHVWVILMKCIFTHHQEMSHRRKIM